jgi:parallel beta-helix repeat protein
MMLCPHCLRPGELAPVEDPEQGRVLRCPTPGCDFPTIPTLYAEDYPAHPPTPVSIIGLSGHGKTVFIEALLQEIQTLGARWAGSGFFFTWLDEVQMRNAYRRIRALRTGQLPKGTKTVFQQPQVLRLSNIPRVGGSQLVIFDTGGEAFLDSSTLADAAKYVRHSASVIWLLSLKKGDPYDTPDDVNQMVTVYLQTMSRLGGRTQDQTLILVLTKGDELIHRPDLPASARAALEYPDYSPAGSVWNTLEAASADLEAWLRSDRCGYHNLINLVKSRFKSVRYCIVSAQGAPAIDEGLEFGLMPRAVLAPLLWLWRLNRETVWVETHGQREMFLDLADAIASAEGGIVELDDRTYRLPAALTIRHPVRVVGRGAAQTIVEVDHPGYGVGVAAEGAVSLRGLTIRRVGTQPGDVLRVLGGSLELTDVTLTGGLSGTVDGKPVQGTGLLAAKRSRLAASGCHVRGNHGNGVLVIEQADVALADCTFEGNGDAGVFARTAGSVAINRCASRANQTGVWVEAATSAAVEASVCEQNAGCGVVISGQAGATVAVRANSCVGNGRDGIQTRGQSTPQILGNTCTGNRRNGLGTTDLSAPAVRGNVCSGNARNGIRVCDDATPTLEENTAEANAESGILYEDRSSGLARKNTAHDNRGDGIRLEGTAAPTLEANESKRNDGYGLVVSGEKSRVTLNGQADGLTDNKKGGLLDLRPRKSGGWWGR